MLYSSYVFCQQKFSFIQLQFEQWQFQFGIIYVRKRSQTKTLKAKEIDLVFIFDNHFKLILYLHKSIFV